MKYVLNLADDNRILSACVMLKEGLYAEKPIVDDLPTGETAEEKNLVNWLYIDGEYVYDPLPEPEPQEPVPTHEERIASLEGQFASLEGQLASYEAAYAEGVNEA